MVTATQLVGGLGTSILYTMASSQPNHLQRSESYSEPIAALASTCARFSRRAQGARSNSRTAVTRYTSLYANNQACDFKVLQMEPPKHASWTAERQGRLKPRLPGVAHFLSRGARPEGTRILKLRKRVKHRRSQKEGRAQRVPGSGKLPRPPRNRRTLKHRCATRASS